MRPYQFALGALDGIAMFHALPESRRLLFLAASLQGGVMLTHDQRAVPLTFSQTLETQCAIVALGAELEPVADVVGGRLNQAAALGIDLSGGTNRVSLFDVDVELCGCETGIFLRPRQRRTDKLPALGLSLNQLVRRDVRRVHILHQWLVQSHPSLLLFHLYGAGFIAFIGRMGDHAHNKIARRFTDRQSRLAHCLGHLHFVTDMFPLLMALAFDRVGRFRIMRVAYAGRGHLVFLSGTNLGRRRRLYRELWLPGGSGLGIGQLLRDGCL